MTDIEHDPELQVPSDIPQDEQEITCCLDLVGVQQPDCALVALRAERAPVPASTIQEIINLCHVSAETPVTITNASVYDRLPELSNAARSQRVTAAFRFLKDLGGVERKGGATKGAYFEIDLPELALGCRQAQAQHATEIAAKAARGSEPKQKTERMPVQLKNVRGDAIGIQAFKNLLTGTITDDDFKSAAEALLNETMARNESRVVSYTAAQRAIKAVINTPGYGTDNIAARRVVMLAEVMRPLTGRKGDAKLE